MIEIDKTIFEKFEREAPEHEIKHNCIQKPKCESSKQDTDGNWMCCSDYWFNPCEGLSEQRKNCWRWKVQ